MLIQFVNLLLASPDASLGVIGPAGLTVNGAQIVDEVDFFRAVARTFFARGNRGTTVQFSVTQTYASKRAAEVALLTHFAGLPTSGDLVVTCGDGADLQACTLAGAVLDAVPTSYSGQTVTVQYTFRGGLFTTSSIPAPLTPAPGETAITMRRDTVAVTTGATSLAVVFSTALASPPAAVTCNLIIPSGGDAVWAWPRDGSWTVSGFTADFSGPASAGCKLSYSAFL